MDRYDQTPDELKAVRQWHCWKLVDDTKIPIQVNGAAAKSNDPETWTDFETAAGAAGYYSGLAFELSEPWTGIDLDDCIDDNGTKPWVWEILCRFDGLAFAEVSPSGTGIKLITRARKPEGARSSCKIEGGRIEVYDNRRFWTVTGDIYNGQTTIGDGQAEVDWLLKTYLARHDKPATPPVVESQLFEPVPTAGSLERRVESYLASVPQAAEGGRELAAFSLAGHLRSFEHDGQRLSDDQVTAYCRAWNAANPKPLPEGELLHAIRCSATAGTPRETKPNRLIQHVPSTVDLSAFLSGEQPDELDDEAFCASLIPETGLLRQVFDFYCETATRRSCIMGAAVAISLCETIFGRRIKSHTDMRTNDYNVILAPTAGGKEACETTLTKIFLAAGSSPMIPPDVQSGNGLLKAVSEMPCGIWICDEFGKVLESILEQKGNPHAKAIGLHLLKLYSKSAGVYGGAAHADGIRNQILQPHLCVLGLTTGQVFETLDSRNVKDGLFGRIAFWPVQTRPPRRSARAKEVPADLVAVVRMWREFEPVSGNMGLAEAVLLDMTPEATKRWDDHGEAIDSRMDRESESRAAIWGRVAARSMKLAMVHRAARLLQDPGTTDWSATFIELEDVNWGIRAANWLGRVACGLIRENVADTQGAKVRSILERALMKHGTVNRKDLLREFRSISLPEFTAAAESLQAEGRLRIEVDSSKPGRPKTFYCKPESQDGLLVNMPQVQ